MSEPGETIEITGRAVRLYRSSPAAGATIDRQVSLRDFLREIAASSPQALLPTGWLAIPLAMRFREETTACGMRPTVKETR